MKTHATLKELLEAYSDYCQEIMWNDDGKDLKEFAKPFLAFNNLALGKPEPLAKNKDSESNFCECRGYEKVDRWHRNMCVICKKERRKIT